MQIASAPVKSPSPFTTGDLERLGMNEESDCSRGAVPSSIFRPDSKARLGEKSHYHHDETNCHQLERKKKNPGLEHEELHILRS